MSVVITMTIPNDVPVDAQLRDGKMIMVGTPGATPFLQGALFANATKVLLTRSQQGGVEVARVEIAKLEEGEWKFPVIAVDDHGALDPMSSHCIALDLLSRGDEKSGRAGLALLEQTTRRSFFPAIVTTFDILWGNTQTADAAVDMLSRAVREFPHPMAMWALGRRLARVARLEGLEWLERAAREGYLKAQVSLGIFLSPLARSRSPRTDAVQAAVWLGAAVETGEAPGIAYYELAKLYRIGCGVPADEERALALYAEGKRREPGLGPLPSRVDLSETASRRLRRVGVASEASSTGQPSAAPDDGQSVTSVMGMARVGWAAVLTTASLAAIAGLIAWRLFRRRR